MGVGKKERGKHHRWKKTATTGTVRRVFLGNFVEPGLALLVLPPLRLPPVATMTVAPGLVVVTATLESVPLPFALWAAAPGEERDKVADPLPFVPYPPVERHGVVGDRRTTALVAADGTVGWLCLPCYDNPPVFVDLLDTTRAASGASVPLSPLLATSATSTVAPSCSPPGRTPSPGVN